jgi:hypothetical protein
MSLTRRSFVGRAASAFGVAATVGSSWTQVASPGLTIPPTAAGKAFAKAIGESSVRRGLVPVNNGNHRL